MASRSLLNHSLNHDDGCCFFLDIVITSEKLHPLLFCSWKLQPSPYIGCKCMKEEKLLPGSNKSWQQHKCRLFLDFHREQAQIRWLVASPSLLNECTPAIDIHKAKTSAQQVVKHIEQSSHFCDYIILNDVVCHEGLLENTVSQKSVKILSMCSQCVPGSLSSPRREEPGDEARPYLLCKVKKLGLFDTQPLKLCS